MQEELLCMLLVLLGYGLGAVPFGLVVSKAFNLPDPRTVGSRNVGFTNVLRVSGAKRDELQEAIALVKKSVTDYPVQFGNFRD